MDPSASACDLLLVEDNPWDEELILRSLERGGLAVRTSVVRHGEEALDFLHGRGRHAGRAGLRLPRAILLDLKLPGPNGHAIVRAVRSDPRLRHLPVVMLTSSQQDRDVGEAYAEGVNSYIVKPVDFERFLQVVFDAARYWVHLNEPPG